MYCLDTYALVEIHNKNPIYSHFLEEEFVIPEIMMAEFYSLMLRDYSETIANYWLGKLDSYLQPVPMNVLVKAVKYRHDHKKQNLSFFDCVGYMFAREKGIPFVTGDKEFKDKEGVEFVK